MANDFDRFPLDDNLTKNMNKISDVWRDSLATFYENLVSYLSSNGLLPPQLTSAQRDAINSPQNGQIIYNTTLGTNQYFNNGNWTSF